MDVTAVAQDDTPRFDEVAAFQPSQNEIICLEKHVQLIDNLLTSIDALISVELAALYYHDTTFLTLLPKTIVQQSLGSVLVSEPTLHTPLSQFLMICTTTISSVLLHLWKNKPEANEDTRYYIQGGLLLDFVGVRGPVSKFTLLGYDVLIVVLQLIFLAIIVQRAEVGVKGASNAAPTIADHDREELGVTRQGSRHLTSDEDIELDDLSSVTIRSGSTNDAHVLDRFYTGKTMILEIDMRKTVALVKDGDTAIVVTPPATRLMDFGGYRFSLLGR